MESVLKFDRVVLIKELNDKIKKLGEVFEIANVLEDSFVLRETKSRAAVGVISFADFEEHFVHAENFKGWTQWCMFVGFDGQNDCMYRTNGKKVQVKFLTDKVRGEACCSKVNDFNLSYGIQLAYLRALNKVNLRKITEYEETLKQTEENLKQTNIEVMDNERIIQKMINSLPA